ncbi:MAG: ABC transporter permease [Candidatus Omnitrophota bacterium]
MFRKLAALFKRDLCVNSSYKLSFAVYWVHSLAVLLPFFFIARLLSANASPHLLPYGGDYFPFVLIGLGLRRYLSHALHSLAGSIGEEQGLGTLEALLVTPVSFRSVFFLLSVLSFLYATLNLLFYLFLGVFLFHVRLPLANIPGALVVLGLTTMTFYAFGLFSASFILVFKKGSIVEPFLEGFSSFLGGVYFPITLLPLWLQKTSDWIPMTYALRALRLCLLKGLPLGLLKKDLLVLTALTLILFPISVWIFGKALRKAKKDGSLVHY